MIKIVLISMLVALVAEIVYRWISTRIDSAKLNVLTNIVLAICAIGLISLNAARVSDMNFWGDECFSINLARMHFDEMLKATAADVHPPLYYAWLMLLISVLGDSAWVIRLSAFIPYVLTVIFGLTIIRKEFGKRVSVLFITFCSITDMAIKYNVEARMYSFAALMVLLSFFFMYQILEHGGSRACYVLFTVCSLGAAYLHYYALLAVAFFYLALLIIQWKNKKERKRVLIVYGLTILCYLPWLGQFLTTFQRTADSFWWDHICTLREITMTFWYSERDWYTYFMLCVFIMLCVAGVVQDKKNGILLVGILSSLGVIVVGQTASILIHPMFMTRYLYPILSVVWLVFCVLLVRNQHTKYLVLFFTCVTVMIYLPMYQMTCETERNDNQKCKETYLSMKSALTDEDVILTNGNHLGWTVLKAYFPQNENTNAPLDAYEFESDKQYWLAWYRPVSDEEELELKKQGLDFTKVIDDGLLGDNSLYLYSIHE